MDRTCLEAGPLLEEVRPAPAARSIHVISGFRTPAYNSAIGNETDTSLHIYGKAADVWVEGWPSNNLMDDIDRNKRIDVYDGEFLVSLTRGLEARGEVPVGGASAYRWTESHGPYVHNRTPGAAPPVGRTEADTWWRIRSSDSPKGNNLKSNQTVLLASMAVCLGASLLTLAYSSRKVSGWSEAAEEHRLQALRTSLRCDTLAAVNSFLAAEAESALVLRRQNDSLRLRLEEARLASEFPGYYLVIDTFQNRFHLRRGGMLVRSGFVGTGKGWTESANGQTWDFSTPRGLRQVLYKTRNPYWFRPDWYWQEQSLTPPPPGQEVVIPQDLSWEEQVAFFNDSLTVPEGLGAGVPRP